MTGKQTATDRAIVAVQARYVADPSFSVGELEAAIEDALQSDLRGEDITRYAATHGVDEVALLPQLEGASIHL